MASLATAQPANLGRCTPQMVSHMAEALLHDQPVEPCDRTVDLVAATHRPGWITSTVENPAGARIALIDSALTTYLWDVAEQRLLAEYWTGGSDTIPLAPSFSADGAWLATPCVTCSTTLVSMRTLKRVANFPGQFDPIFSPTRPDRLYTLQPVERGAFTEAAWWFNVWDLSHLSHVTPDGLDDPLAQSPENASRLAVRVPVTLPGGRNKVVINTDGTMVAVLTHSEATLIDLRTFAVRRMPLPTASSVQGHSTGIALNTDGTLAFVLRDDLVHVLSTVSGRVLHRLPAFGASMLLLSDDGRSLALGSYIASIIRIYSVVQN
ncbi:MAG: hypothetical protein IPK19_15200 [Chloroflexi bacterium]|nr:hypothetical protein [Chloroflexota bacterium]